MKPLAICQLAFNWFCVVYTTDKSLSSSQKKANQIFRWIYAVILVSEMIFVVISSVQLVSNDLEEALFAFFQMGISAMILNGFITMVSSGFKVAQIFEDLTQIYDKCEIEMEKKK